MDITITISPEQERAINHILAYNRIHGADVESTAESYVTAELENKVQQLTLLAEEKRKKYIEEVYPQLNPTKIADLAEYVFGLLNN